MAEQNRLSAWPWALACAVRDRRAEVYNQMPYRFLDEQARPTAETIMQALDLWPMVEVTGYKIAQKRDFFITLFHNGKLAYHNGECIAYSRFEGEPNAVIKLQVIDAAKRAGWFEDIRSRPGSPKRSRLVPRKTFEAHIPKDPWKLDQDRMQRLVYIYDRETEEDISPPPTHPLVAEYQGQLERMNSVINRCEILHRPYSTETKLLLDTTKQLRPRYHIVFTDGFDQHGRLYTGRYGHQSLRKIERQTITFNGEPSVELDFCGLHCRMLYHIMGTSFHADPYAIWEEDATRAMRRLAKLVVNIAINARDYNAAIRACNAERSDMVYSEAEGWEPKRGRNLERALQIQQDLAETGLTFKAIYARMLEYHSTIELCFNSDLGIRLMNLDGLIAFQVVQYFVTKGIPCLACHDSFIVPRRWEQTLTVAMRVFYQHLFSENPEIK